jgi:hypothetical protein
MKLLFLLLNIGFFSPESKVDRIPQSNSEYAGCDSREVAAEIHAGTKVPRGTIYHYGKKEILVTDIAEGNIPQSDWDDYIMGEKTRFKLKRFRRGFYGTEYAEDADRFGDSTYNWLVKITLNPECLVSSRVTSLVYLSKSELFQKWYGSKSYVSSFEKYKTACFDSEGNPGYKAFNNYKNPSETADFKESECERVIADYYEDQKFAFVHDHAGDLVRSWAIRDRDCIRNNQGLGSSIWVKELRHEDLSSGRTPVDRERESSQQYTRVGLLPAAM